MVFLGFGSKNRIDKLANKLHKNGQIDKLESELESFNPNKLNKAEKESWYHIWGISAYQRGEYDKALERFKEAFRNCPDSGEIAFSLGQEYEYIGEINNMIDLFDQFKFPKISAQYSFAQARYAYLWDLIDKAIEYIDPIFDTYNELKIVDDNFLYLRGLPFFGDSWAYLGTFHELNNDLTEFKEFTNKLSKKLSDYDFNHLITYLDAIINDDFSILIQDINKHINEHKDYNIPSGYQKTKIAILQATQESDINKALSIIENVKIEENDFQWLNDMLLLVKCFIHSKSGNTKLEKELIVNFINKQAL